MLSVDQSNIDGPPLAVKCVRKFGSALGGEVVRARVCVCVCVHFTREGRTFIEERTPPPRCTVGFSFSFVLVNFESPGINEEMMVACVYSTHKNYDRSALRI